MQTTCWFKIKSDKDLQSRFNSRLEQNNEKQWVAEHILNAKGTEVSIVLVLMLFMNLCVSIGIVTTDFTQGFNNYASTGAILFKWSDLSVWKDNYKKYFEKFGQQDQWQEETKSNIQTFILASLYPLFSCYLFFFYKAKLKKCLIHDIHLFRFAVKVTQQLLGSKI